MIKERNCADLLIEKKLKITVAESCTGGLISTKLTSIPGSSEYFDRGFVTYSNEAKITQLNVQRELINNFGAVSEETATAMAKGALENSHADIAVSVTGIAGPSGGTPEKPVGTVFIAIASDGSVSCKQYVFSGDRTSIREETSEQAMHDLCQVIRSGKISC